MQNLCEISHNKWINYRYLANKCDWKKLIWFDWKLFPNWQQLFLHAVDWPSRWYKNSCYHYPLLGQYSFLGTLMKKPGNWFALAKYAKNTCAIVTFLVQLQVSDLYLYIFHCPRGALRTPANIWSFLQKQFMALSR